MSEIYAGKSVCQTLYRRISHLIDKIVPNQGNNSLPLLSVCWINHFTMPVFFALKNNQTDFSMSNAIKLQLFYPRVILFIHCSGIWFTFFFSQKEQNISIRVKQSQKETSSTNRGRILLQDRLLVLSMLCDRSYFPAERVLSKIMEVWIILFFVSAEHWIQSHIE